MNSNNEKIKQTNFELMRIISMFLIVIYHIIVHGKLIENFSSPSYEITFNFIKGITLVAVNSYIILTGYFQSKLHFKFKKFLLILFQYIFYKIIIYLLLGCFNIIPVTKELFINYFFPDELEYWFVFYYLILYLLSNILNKIINKLNINKYTILLTILTFILSITPMITNGIIIKNTGFSLIQFIYLYFIGAYIRIIIEKNKNNHLKRKYYYLFTYLITTLLVVIIYYIFLNSNLKTIAAIGIIKYSFYYSSPFVIIQTISYFLFFSTLNITNKNINNFSKYILGIYLIHDNSLIREKLYFFNNLIINTNNILLAIILTIIAAIIIFCISYLISYCISKIFLSLKKDNQST